ncbi:hypothetical protein SAMN02910317_00457 [Ruminococcaceae bacterium FB2012]|nr:hypothetical protein SAMN02910317_00457 [Ruminococcaceae bacterium FB2012]
MRRLNSAVTVLIAALFAVHAALGGFQLMGVLGSSPVRKALAWIMLGLVGVHMLISIKLTADTFIALRRSGACYFRENKLFWIRRISGIALMFFILSHLLIFFRNGEPVRLGFFGTAQLITQILLGATLALHILTDLRPLMISLGLKSCKELMLDGLFITSVILLFSGAGFAVYFIRWL